MRIRWIVPIAASAAGLSLLGCGNSTTANSSGASGKPAESSAGKKEITEDNVPEMTVDEVEAGLAKAGSLFVFDANPKDVYEEGHVPGAKWVPKKVTADMLPADKSSKLVFYCASEN